MKRRKIDPPVLCWKNQYAIKHKWTINIKRVITELKHRIARLYIDDPIIYMILEDEHHDVVSLSYKYSEKWYFTNVIDEIKVMDYIKKPKEKFTCKDDVILLRWCIDNNITNDDVTTIWLERHDLVAYD
jgi:hypothetical protein